MIESEIGTIAANVVAQTDPAADTETLVETIQLPYDITIKEINFLYLLLSRNVFPFGPMS